MIDATNSFILNRIFILVHKKKVFIFEKQNLRFLLLLKCTGVLELSTLLKCFTAPTWRKACTLVLNTNLGLFNVCTISDSLRAMYSGCGLQIMLFFNFKAIKFKWWVFLTISNFLWFQFRLIRSIFDQTGSLFTPYSCCSSVRARRKCFFTIRTRYTLHFNET